MSESELSFSGTLPIVFASAAIVILILASAIRILREYERAVIFRLGRLLKGGAKGPGESV